MVCSKHCAGYLQVFMGKIQQFRGPLIQTHLRLRLMNQTRNMNRGQMMARLCICPCLSFFIIVFLVVFFLIPFLFPPHFLLYLASFIFIDVLLYFGESIKFQFLSYSLFTLSTSPIDIIVVFPLLLCHFHCELLQHEL